MRVKASFSAALVAGVMLLCACSARTIKVDTAVVLDKPGADVRVQMVGVPAVEREKYENYPVDKWFSPGDPLRSDAEKDGIVKEMLFGPGKANAQVLSKKDAIWKTWETRKADYVIILANMRASESKTDPRKYVLPLSNERWGNLEKLTVTIRGSGIQVEPPPKAIEAK